MATLPPGFLIMRPVLDNLQRLTVTAMAAAMLVCAAGQATSLIAAPPEHQGSYEVVIRGSYTGKGTIAVAAKSVTINLQVVNETGQTGQLIVPNVALENNRFTGAGTVFGQAMTISGRIDPPAANGPPTKYTIQATFSVSADIGGRIVGVKRGGGS